MKITRFDNNGKYTSVVSTTQEGADLEIQDRILLKEIDTQLFYHDLKTNLPVAIGEKPSEFHFFDYTHKKWVTDLDDAWNFIKQKRDKLLAGSDWRITKSIETGQPVPDVWLSYRQALRDITLQSDPVNLIWPVEPQ